MFTNFPQNSKVWVYQSSRNLSDEECFQITEKSNSFLSTWNTHGLALKTAALLKYNRFILICADEREAKAGGCSMDKLTRFIQSLERDFEIDFFNRMLVAYKCEANVSQLHLNELKLQLQNGSINLETIVFNNLVSNLEDLNKAWELPLKESWHFGFCN